jgi:hypothetical protein
MKLVMRNAMERRMHLFSGQETNVLMHALVIPKGKGVQSNNSQDTKFNYTLSLRGSGVFLQQAEEDD